MVPLTRLNIRVISILVFVLTGCAPRSASLAPLRQSLTWRGLPASCVFRHEEKLSTIAECFYGTDSLITTHVLWHANPDLRGRGWVNPGEKVTIPVLLDQSAPFSVGDTIYLLFDSGCPPGGTGTVIAKDGFALFAYGVKVKAAGQTPAQVAAAIERAYVPEIFVSLNVTVIRVEGTLP